MKTTYQYSVKEHARPIDHEKGSHGTPGIYFKYDLAAFKVQVTKDRLGWRLGRLQLTVSLSGKDSSSSWSGCAPVSAALWPHPRSCVAWPREGIKEEKI